MEHHLEHHLDVVRTARYHTAGGTAQADDVWYLLHGYGQLAAGILAGAGALGRPGRCLVAPEALSRFYVDPSASGSHARSVVGASWMTREDREAEIRDQLGYLDALHRRILGLLPAAPRRVTVLGFSQGAAAAARWCAHGAVRPDLLILGGGVPPDDLSADGSGRLGGMEVRLVRGNRDALVSESAMALAASLLAALGARVELLSFAGGHRLDDATLARFNA